MSLFYILSAPADPTKKDTLIKLSQKLSVGPIAEVTGSTLPEFKIGTLDALYLLSDELNKSEPAVEAIALKLSENMKSLLNNDLQQWKTNLTVNEKSVEVYVKNFNWNALKYRTDKSLKEMADAIMQEVNSIDTLTKSKMQTYSQIKTALSGAQRKQIGSLAVKSLNGIVKKDNFVLNSEYLITLMVAVPKASESAWLNSYESLTQMVVPRSSQKIAGDDEFYLYSVTLFQRVVDEFTAKARENKFTVRDFKWDEAAMAKEKEEQTRLSAAEKEQWTSLLRLCKTNFGEVFQCMMHLKALRLYVESILRYGLPPDFQPMIAIVPSKNEKKFQDTLKSHFAKLGSSLGGNLNSGKKSGEEAIDDKIASILGDTEYLPYVLFPILVPTS